MKDLLGRKVLLKASGLKKGRVLDVGMGSCGCMSIFLANKGFEVIGIDHFPEAVHEVRENIKKKKFKGTFEARLANAENLPFEENEFDAVISYHSMHHMKDVEKVIDEMFRVCKRGGSVLISDLYEKGRKSYGHEADGGELLGRVEKALTKYANFIKKVNTRSNIIFICKKGRGR